MQHLKVIPILMLCTFVSLLRAEDHETQQKAVSGTKENFSGVKITIEKAQFRTPSHPEEKFRLEYSPPGTHQNSVDPGCFIEVDDSIDPDMIVEVDPNVDPEMVVKIPPKSDIESKIVILKKDTLR